MATLERRIAELESRVHTENRLLVQIPRHGSYSPVPDGFTGAVHWVVFGKQATRPKEFDHGNA